MRKAQRQHHMCVKELIGNIIEMEAIIGEEVEPKVLKEILWTCPLDYELPYLDEIPRPPKLDSE